MNAESRWTVAEVLPEDKVRIECQCGRAKTVTATDWEAGKGLKHLCSYDHELIGERFGRLVVGSPRKERIRNNIAFNCRCDCGQEQIAIGADLKRGNVRSCGCLQREIASQRAKSRFPTSEGYISYGYAHILVKKKKGSPTEYSCLCGAQAREWAYDGQDPNELVGQATFTGMTYSRNEKHYVPLCTTCHRMMDQGKAPELLAVLGGK